MSLPVVPFLLFFGFFAVATFCIVRKLREAARVNEEVEDTTQLPLAHLLMSVGQG